MLHFASYFLAQQLICCVHVFVVVRMCRLYRVTARVAEQASNSEKLIDLPACMKSMFVM